MKRPAFFDYLLGNPVALLATCALLVAALYQWWQGVYNWAPAAIMAVLTSWSFKSSERITAYRNWKREWEGMEATARRSASPLLRRTVGFLTFDALLLYFYSERGDPTYLLMLVVLVTGGTLWVIYLFVRWAWSRRTRAREVAQKNAVVTQCLKDPLLPMPPLSVAYQRLPPHCHAVLRPPAKPLPRSD